MASSYVMQIKDRATGEVAEWEPGRAVEMDFVDACAREILGATFGDVSSPWANIADDIVAEVKERGVGLFRTEAHVLEDVRTAINAVIVKQGPEKALASLKDAFHAAITTGIGKAIYNLKSRVAPR